MIIDKTFAGTIKEKCINCSVKNETSCNDNLKEGISPIDESTDIKIIHELNKNLKNPIPRVGLIQYNKSGYRVEEGYVLELSIVSEDCEEIFSEICKLNHLEKLTLRKSFLKTIPIEIVNLKQLLYLDLKKNYIQTIPEELYNLSTLQYLDLSYNNMRCFSTEKNYLLQLEILILDHNNLEKIIFSDNSCLNLRECFLDHNNINEVQIDRIKSLTYLALQNNNLKTMPSIHDLINLESLELHYNKLNEIKTDFSNLQSLESISLSYNNISDINFESLMESKVKYCFINGNPLNKTTKRKYTLFLQNNQ